jgi:thiamine biosynthesis lipoprotein
MRGQLDYAFRAMGSDVRFLIGAPLVPGSVDPLATADRERAYVQDFGFRLSRFEPDSELSALNADPRAMVPCSALLLAAVRAGLWAAERSGGLVDPTLVRALVDNGYASSLDGDEPASLADALSTVPARRPASPDPASPWRQIVVDDRSGTVSRPPGVQFDTGGTGKGLCADAVAWRLRGFTRFVVDCGGDIALGGIGAEFDPYEIAIEHPLTGGSIGTLRLARGGVATSGLNVRIWRDAAGGFRHHLLDPSTGTPAWTGLIGATAVAGSALEAETLSKMALLLGAAGAREVLAEQGGVIVHDDGEVELIGPLPGRVAGAMRAPAVGR